MSRRRFRVGRFRLSGQRRYLRAQVVVFALQPVRLSGRFIARDLSAVVAGFPVAHGLQKVLQPLR